MNHKHTIAARHSLARGSINKYVIGFALSIAVTLCAYAISVNHNSINDNVANASIIIMLVFLGIVQLGVQLRYFIHLGHEAKPYWNKLVFAYMVIMVLIVGIGSLWIMNNLDYNMMPPSETDTYIKQDEGIGR